MLFVCRMIEREVEMQGEGKAALSCPSWMHRLIAWREICLKYWPFYC